MALQQPVSSNAYLRPIKLAINSREDKKDSSQSDFNYTAVLKEEIQNVVGMAITYFSMPRNASPTFYPTTSFATGKNRLDFSLENSDIAGAAQTFSITWPTKHYAYQEPAYPDHDYLRQCEILMNEAIDADATWKEKVWINLTPHPLNNTLMTVSVIDTSLPSTSTTELKLLFASGANAANSVFTQMGFAQLDYTSSPSLLNLNTGSQTIESPNPVALNPFPYIDIFVQESNQRPLKRIYTRDENYTTVFNAESVNQLPLDTDNPPRRLRELNIRIRYQNGQDPGDFVNDATPHSIGFTIMQLADENQPIPGYTENNLMW